MISKSALGIRGSSDPCSTARDCLSKAAGDKVRAIRLSMHETDSDLERARKVIESDMVMGWQGILGLSGQSSFSTDEPDGDEK